MLERLNQELNGLLSSESFVGASDVPRSVAYSVSVVAGMLRDAGRHDAAERVDTAWRAVLDGDIDDLAEHVEFEHPPSA